MGLPESMASRLAKWVWWYSKRDLLGETSRLQHDTKYYPEKDAVTSPLAV